ncbi:hypothetical protein Pmani_010442 [Petrolisthes manimaculis]|uniref:Reelin domain-containing protein n=1 Tax=Petrolisthes manimaculis TaxID=1843537 RepID=A0AAE1Q347_9EUCA|nr:hypothetical protein Pmani_010442 [Petrolisthes manimaculis]
MSNHVPASACAGMKPLGHNIEPQISLPPYYIDVIPPTVPNQAFQVVLAADDVPFKGFFIKAFDQITGKVVGSFTKSSADVATIDCGASGFGAHHTSSTDKTSVVLNWQPPSDYTGSVSFMATVVQSFSVYWMDVVSPLVAVAGI